MMTLDAMGLAGFTPCRFNDIGINSALGEPVGIGNTCCLFLENIDKEIADDPAFLFRVGDADERLQKAVFSIDPEHLYSHVFSKSSHHLIAFGQPQQAVIYKDAGKLITNGPVDQGCGN